MRGAHSKATVFVLGLAGCAIPCVALALNEPLGELTNPATPAATKDDLALIPSAKLIETYTKGEWGVQVGVFATRDAAQAQLDRLVALVPDYDLQQDKFVVPHTDDSKNEFYRAQFTGLTESDARSLCNTLGGTGMSCFIFRTAIFESDKPLEAVSPAQAVSKDASTEGGQSNSNFALAAMRPISNDDLENARGGFSVGGVNFNFGASVQTLVNGQLALQTTVQWTPTGAVVTQVQGLGTKIDAQVTSTLANAGITKPTTGNAAPVSTTTTPLTQTASAPTAVSTVPVSAPASGPVTIPTTSNVISTPATSSPTSTASMPVGQTTSALSPTAAASVIPAVPVISNAPQSSAIGSVAGAQTSLGLSISGGSITPLSVPAAPSSATPSNVVSIPTTVSNPPSATAPVPVNLADVPSSALASSPGNGLASTGASSPNNIANVPATASNPPATTVTVPINFVSVPSGGSGSTSSPLSVGAPNTSSQAGLNTLGADSSSNSPTILTGVQIQSATGTTQVLANVTNGQIQNIILNTASNQNIVQDTNITLTIYNFAAWQQTLAQNSMAMQLANQVLAASGFRGLH